MTVAARHAVTPSPPTTRRLIDPWFRWRGTSVSRMEAFSDAVFAIVLALLFLRSAPPETFRDLEVAMKGLVPFAASFAIVAYVWVEHWVFSRRYDLQDGTTQVLNLVLLFLLLFYAYPLKFLFTLVSVVMFGPIGSTTHASLMQGFGGAADGVELFAFYGSGYGLMFLVLGTMYWRALRLASHLQLDRGERFLTRSAILQCLLQAAVAVLSIVLAWTGLGLEVGLPGWIYGCLGPLMALHGRWQHRRLRAIVGDGA